MKPHRVTKVFLLLTIILILSSGTAWSAEPTDEVQQLSYKEFLAKNQTNILNVTAGMTKEQAISVMKDYSTEIPESRLGNPYKAESFRRGEDTYEILYYLTRPHPRFAPIDDAQATPIVIKNGKVVGSGANALKGIR